MASAQVTTGQEKTQCHGALAEFKKKKKIMF